MVRIETLISPVLLLVKSGLIQKVKKRSYKNHSLHWDIEVASKNDIFTTLAHIHSMFYPNLDLLAAGLTQQHLNCSFQVAVDMWEEEEVQDTALWEGEAGPWLGRGKFEYRKSVWVKEGVLYCLLPFQSRVQQRPEGSAV